MLIIIIAIPLIPTLFIMANTIMTMIVKLFLQNDPIDSNNIALAIFNSSFMNGVHHLDYISAFLIILSYFESPHKYDPTYCNLFMLSSNIG